MLNAKILNVYTNNAPKNKTIPNSKKIVVLLGITIFLNEYVGNLLINNNDVVIKNIGTTKSYLILTKSNSLKLIINGVKTKIPPAGEGTPSKKLSFQDGF